MLLKILQAGNPILRARSETLSVEEIKSYRIQQLIQLMVMTMRDAPGVGLAAPQVGESLQLTVIEDRDIYTMGWTEQQRKEKLRQPIPLQVCINPKLTILSTERALHYEGCLSLPGYVGVVPRALRVKIEALDEKGNAFVNIAEGWHARILQHEIDHLQGCLCIDHMDMHTFMSVDNYKRYS